MVSQLPVRRMVLYKHGIGFFERRGPVEGGSTKLTFKRSEMDDILKSLIVLDHGGGRVTGVAYETAEDIAQVIAEKALVPPDREALLGLLRLVRGYKVALDTHSGKVEGAVVGTDETEVKEQDDGRSVNQKVVVRSSDGALHPVPVKEITSVRLLDAEASDDLRFYLEAVTSERKKHQRSVTVFMEGEKHDLGVRYIAPTPNWRVSYRLDHGPEGTFLQAWGIIDNRLDEDLKDVRLTLVAGKPISFIYDIYVPRMASRPVVREEIRGVGAPVELEAAPEFLAAMTTEDTPQADFESYMDGTQSQTMRGGVGAAAGAAFKAMAASRSSRVGSMPMSAPGPAPPPAAGEAMLGSTRVQTKMVEAGEFFRYDIEAPVTIPRGQSAMVPILNLKISGKKEHVYNPGKVPLNPVVALRLKNDSGAVLERGPAVVLDDGTYAGEGIMPYTSLAGEAHVAYAVDLGVQVKEEHTHESVLTSISVDRAYLRKEMKTKRTTKYSIDNRKTEPVDLVIEHATATDWVLVEPAKPAEELPGLRRFRLELKAKTHADLAVKEEHVSHQYEEVAHVSAETLGEYLKGGYLKPPAAEKVKALWDLYRKRVSLQQELQSLQHLRGQMQTEQGRLRENLRALGTSRQEEGLRASYVAKLEAQEKQFEALARREQELVQTIQTTDREVEMAVEALTEKRT
ncbi:MAG TPA: hypothetical protein VI893_01195 [Thermoplasmata archaeon]|nr:hypothetical protein [Thermoplasmata archaeon]